MDFRELIRDVLLPHSLLNWRKRVGGQLKTGASTIKDDIAAQSDPQVVGLRRWNRDWLAISCGLAQDRRTWAAMVRDAVLARFGLVWFVGFYGISTFVGYLTPNPFLCK